jgi:hypothetical protein
MANDSLLKLSCTLTESRFFPKNKHFLRIDDAGSANIAALFLWQVWRAPKLSQESTVLSQQHEGSGETRSVVPTEIDQLRDKYNIVNPAAVPLLLPDCGPDDSGYPTSL